MEFTYNMIKRGLSLLYIFLGISLAVNAQVTADFLASPTAGCGPLIVQFNNQSNGSGNLTFQWNFGNGNSSTATNPSATYVNPGTYTVTLTVSNGSQTDTEVKTGYITVFEKPTPDFSSSVTQGCFPLSVDFSDLSIPGSSGIESWYWDFGDGNISTQQNPTHTYLNAGTYDVTLLLIDSNNCQDDVTFSDYITVSSNFPTADFSGNPLFGCNPPTQVNFVNNSSGNGTLTYSWNFGNGQNSSQTNPSHTYTDAGLYDVTLTVTDQIGCIDSLVRSGYVNVVDSVNVDFLSSTINACVGQNVSFFDNSTATPISWQWDFGDGGTANTQNPGHVYNTPGTYTVSLMADYVGSCSGTEIKTAYITVSDVPVPSFTVDNNSGCHIPFTANFTNTTTGGNTYIWDFGDGQTSNDVDPSHDYGAPGSYTVSLTAINSSGCSVTQTETDFIIVTQTEADFLPDKFGFCVPLEVNFADSSTSAQTITSWHWDFGDGATSSQQNPTHTYTTTGMFTVTLIIEDDLGCRDTVIRPNYIFVSTPPTANFTGGPFQICAGAIVQFTDLSTNANEWYWDFGNMTFSTEQNPEHEWNDTGYFDITLTAFNNGCPDTFQIPDYVYLLPPVSEFEYLQSCSAPYTVEFIDESIGAFTYNWDFGDGTSSTLSAPIHTFPSTGLYTVMLTVTSDTNNCSNTSEADIEITDPQANFSAVNNSGCGPLTVDFTDQSADAVSWLWNFGDGGTSGLQNPTHTYISAGIYDVRLIVTDIYGCRDTLLVSGVVNVSGSTPDFELVSSSGCDSLEAVFADLSTPPGTVLQWYWDFGDGTTSSQQNPTHYYHTGGLYTVSLTIDDNAGCTYTETKPDYVYYDPYPDPSFSPSSTNVCRGIPITFTNFTTGATSYLWDFGDDNTSNEISPTYTYMADGTYTITLTATNDNGCDSTIVFTDLITVGSPDADYSAAPTAAVCPPLLVTFTDQSSSNANQWVWNFGDGSSSTQQNPQHIYTQPGVYDVELIVFSSIGCSDTILMEDLINLSGPVGSFTFMPDTTGCPPFDVTYEAVSPNATSFTWDFGDGSLGSGQTTTHTYTDTGEYFPLLILEDINGCSFIVQAQDSVVVKPLAVDAGLDTTVCREVPVQLNASGGSVYSWSPTQGLSNPNSSNPIATPSSTTTYYVTVQQGQCQNVDSITIVIVPTPIADFDFTEVCFGLETDFTDLSTIQGDSIISWTWEFGDSNTSNDTSPSHIYGTANAYDVILEVASSNGCVDSVVQTVNVFATPIADFSANDVCLGDMSEFTDQSTVPSGTINSWTWLFGDGATSSQQNPTHIYNSDTSYSVTLIIGSSTACSDSITQTHAIHPIPQVDFGAMNVCFGSPVNFSDSTTINSGSIDEWLWQFGDSVSSTSQNPTHVYNAPGSYNVNLVATSNFGCETNLIQQVTIYPLPISSFEVNSQFSCTYPVNVAVTNLSTGGLYYHWEFGQGDTSNSIQPVVTTTYDTVGNYTISLHTENQHGCTDDTSLIYSVYPIPNANFNFDTEEGCEPLSVNFTDLSDNAQVYNWQFSDSTSTTTSDPTHIFEEAGNYGVTLIITGAGGCTDTISYQNIIEVWPNPTADFDYVTVADPQIDGTVNFFDQSSPVISWEWDLGDGTTFTEQNPSHQYSYHGDKFIILIVTDSLGCTDTLEEFITVDFYGGLFVPNAIIPNSGNSGINIFLPAGTGLMEYTLEIYDKWGNLIFESSKLEDTSPAEGWDGTYKGEVVPQGAYVWQILAVFDDGNVWPGKVYENGDIRITGTVMVIK